MNQLLAGIVHDGISSLLVPSTNESRSGNEHYRLVGASTKSGGTTPDFFSPKN